MYEAENQPGSEPGDTQFSKPQVSQRIRKSGNAGEAGALDGS